MARLIRHRKHRVSARMYAVAAVVIVAVAGLATAAVRHAAPGYVLRTTALGQSALAVAVDARDGRAFVTTADANDAGSVSMIDMSGGALVHTTRIGASPVMMVADEKTGRLFVGNGGSASVSMLDVRSGRVVRTIIPGCPATAACTPAMGAGPSALAIDTRIGRVFVGGDIAGRGIVSVLDARTGATIALLLAPNGPPYTTGIGGGPMAVDERLGRVFALGDFTDNRLSVLDARSGRLLGAIPVGPNPNSVVAVDARTGRVIVIGVAGMSMLDARSGRLLHVIPMSAAGDIRVDEATGRIVIADAMGKGVSAYDGRNGRPLWTSLAGLYVGDVVVDQRRGHVLVAAGTDVYVLDARSGAILRAIPLDGTAAQLAIDERTGHAVVVTDTFVAPVSDPWGWLPQPLRGWLPPARRQSTGATFSSVSVLDTTR